VNGYEAVKAAWRGFGELSQFDIKDEYPMPDQFVQALRNNGAEVVTAADLDEAFRALKVVDDTETSRAAGVMLNWLAQRQHHRRP
jgi:hypothetical protein